MKITGELLKSERINKNLSVQDVALSLKLSSKIINAIESGNLDQLPAKTFVRGFVKSYAQLLKLDAEQVLRQFQEEMGSTNPLPKVPPPMPVPANENNIKAPRPALKHTSQNYSNKTPNLPNANLNVENPKKVVLMIAIAVGLVVVLVITNKIIDNFKANPVAISAENAEVNTEVSSTAAEANSSDLTSAVSSDNSKPAELAATIESADASQAATPPKDDTPAEEGFAKSSGKPVEVLIEGKKDTEVFYSKADSAKFVSLKISANQVQILRSKVGLYLKSADPAAVKISINGVEYGSGSSNNKPLKLAF